MPVVTSTAIGASVELESAFRDGSTLPSGAFGFDLLTELARASEKRTQMIALAMVLGAAEHGVRDVHTWQSAEGAYWSAHSIPAAARYLAWLAEHTDYGLSSTEAEVAAHATAGTSERTGETGPGPDEDEQERADAHQDQAEPDETAEDGSPASTGAD